MKTFLSGFAIHDYHISSANLRYAVSACQSRQAPQQVSACMGATLTTAEMCASPADVLGVPGMSAARSSRSSPVFLCLSHCTASLKASGGAGYVQLRS